MLELIWTVLGSLVPIPGGRLWEKLRKRNAMSRIYQGGSVIVDAMVIGYEPSRFKQTRGLLEVASNGLCWRPGGALSRYQLPGELRIRRTREPDGSEIRIYGIPRLWSISDISCDGRDIQIATSESDMSLINHVLERDSSGDA